MYRDLVERARAGDQEALARLFDYLAPKVRAFIGSHIDDPNDADDVSQEALLAMLQALRNGNPPRGPIDNWAIGIAWRYLSRYWESGWDCSHNQNSLDYFSLDSLEDAGWEEDKWGPD